jgi:hypothetical protein
MDAAILQKSNESRMERSVEVATRGQLVNATEFRNLLVSHRRMIRVDRRSDRLKGLCDLDTGEIFLTDERRLLDARR